MPLDLLYLPATDSGLGSVSDIYARLTAAMPGIRCYKEPAGLEKLALAKAQGVTFPQVIEEHLCSQPAQHCAELETENWNLGFVLGPGPLVAELMVEVRGETSSSIPLLLSISATNGWRLLHSGQDVTEDWLGGEEEDERKHV